MSYRTMAVDWRGAPNLLKSCDYFSIGPYFDKRPPLGNPAGKVLVAVSATLLYGPEGTPSTRAYNAELYELAKSKGAVTDRVVWSNEAGWSTKLIDVTRRGMVQGWLDLWMRHFGWANGVHLDYASAWSWMFPELAETDAAWESALCGFLSGIRQSGRLALAQQFQLTPVVMAGSGAFWEVNPTMFGQTIPSHCADVRKFRDFAARVDQREVLFVCEVREPGRYPAWYLDDVKRMAESFDVVISAGRDASAGVGL